MYGFIYLTTNNANNKKYIGKRVCRDPLKDSEYLGSGKLLLKAVAKYGKESFSRIILKECINEDDLNKSEEYFIDKYDAVNSSEFYNLKEGGEGKSEKGKIFIHNDTIQKRIYPFELDLFISRGWVKGRKPQPKELVLRRSLKNTGKKRSMDTRLKISKANKGKHPTVETRLKQSLAKLGKPSLHRKKILCIETNMVFESIAQASCDFYRDGGRCIPNISICLNKGKSYKGYHWKFLN